MVKFLVIGDPHGSDKVFDISFNNVDYILIPGDIGKADLMRKYAFTNINNQKSWKDVVSKEEVKAAYLEVIESSLRILKYFANKAPVYLIYGNVEPTDIEIKKLNKEKGLDIPLFEKEIKKIKNVYIINNKVVDLRNILLAGNKYFVSEEWAEEFVPNNKRRLKIAKKEEREAKKFYSKLRKVDILLTHQPPKGILDKVSANNVPNGWKNKHAGSSLILDYIKKYQPRYVFCGHIHESKGRAHIGKTLIYNIGSVGDYIEVEV